MNNFSEELSNLALESANSKYSGQMAEIVRLSRGRPVVLYGAGKAAGLILVACNLAALRVTALCDSNKTGTYQVAEVSLPIISPRMLLEDYADALVIIGSWRHENEIKANLTGMGFEPDRIFSFWLPQRMSMDIFRRDFQAGYEWAYDFYQDNISKKLVLDRARSYLTSQPLVPDTEHKAYYEPEFVFTDAEVFLDGGAYDGDSIMDFVRAVNGSYRQLYGFEPDGGSFGKLQEAAAELANAKVFNVGLGAYADTRLFHFNGLIASGFAALKYFLSPQDKFSDTKFETEMKDLMAIDKFFEDHPAEPLPTFIKLDVEGHEAEALLGAAATISRSRPKLAICAYHKADDIYVLPQTIQKIRNDYRFKLRQCDYGYYETVLYAY
ncbi:MAG: FkbM family methyltransferase [Holophagales bacterium]|jgi:FkbM family methyltransferase|nr:FkbM family methyltransferase [Holophagales bacterium]